MKIKKLSHKFSNPSFAMKIGYIDYDGIGRLGKITVDSLTEALPDLRKMYDDTLTFNAGANIETKELKFRCETHQTIELPALKTEEKPESKKGFIESFFLSKKVKEPNPEYLDYKVYEEDVISTYGISKEVILKEVTEKCENGEIANQRRKFQEHEAFLKDEDLAKSIERLKQIHKELSPKKYNVF